MAQVANPARSDNREVAELRAEVERLTKRINETYGELSLVLLERCVTSRSRHRQLLWRPGPQRAGAMPTHLCPLLWIFLGLLPHQVVWHMRNACASFPRAGSEPAAAQARAAA